MLLIPNLGMNTNQMGNINWMKSRITKEKCTDYNILEQDIFLASEKKEVVP